MSAAEDVPDEIATLRIELLDTEPLIWRQVEIPTAITLKALHDVVQAAMGWHDQHLWELKLGRQRYGRPMPGDDWGGAPTLRAEKVVLAEVLKPRKTVFDYLYDFGDSWEHRLTITDVRLGEPGGVYPRYVTGEHAAPPEDCGGVPGFYAALEALADPDHPEHADVADWLDGYDPNDMNELALKRALGRIASRRRAPTRAASKTRPT
jgi:hypothetical protein